MLSIKAKCNLRLILSLIVIGIVFLGIGYYLHVRLLWLIPIEERAIFVGFVGTILLISIQIGLRMANDINERYEKDIKKTIDQLKTYLIAIHSLVENNPESGFQRLDSAQRRQEDAYKEMFFLQKHGQRYSMKLYPEKTIDRTQKILVSIDAFCKISKELIAEWKENYLQYSAHEDFEKSMPMGKVAIGEDVIYELLFDSIIERNLISKKYKLQVDVAQSIRDKKPEQVKEVQKLREDILKDLPVLEKELEDFIQTN
ncbi:hypothetical protein MUP77_04570 [Candidatus Bathyarchaeota archaeon]|nr:hypothetical protein [Candidatus Bathyarchaeota archaeon]